MGREFEAGRKNFGDALLHPRRFQTSVKKLTASSWLSSSLPFYSPLESRMFAPASWRSAYTVTMYKDCPQSCQEESDCNAQKIADRKWYLHRHANLPRTDSRRSERGTCSLHPDDDARTRLSRGSAAPALRKAAGVHLTQGMTNETSGRGV